MEYSNPELPEGINTSKEHPLKEFAILTIGLLGLIFILISLLIVLVDNFADKIPFALESELPVSSIIKHEKVEKLPPYLEQVTQKVLKSFILPADMKITFHYVNSDTVNAFATLGGHIVLYRGLIEKLKHEDELAMVIAHEIAHVKYRHPIMSASHGVVVGIVLTLLSSSSGNSIVSDLMGTTGTATLMKFSRNFEYQADKDAINSITNLYGHAGGALGLFKVFEDVHAGDVPFELFATHPLTENRISRTTKLANAQHHPVDQARVPLPGKFISWLKQEKEKEKMNNKE